jgi:hypothetical protein
VDLKVAKVVAWLQKNLEGEVSMSEDTISTISEDVREAMRKQFASQRNRNAGFRVRPSNLGRPLCQLQMEKAGTKTADPTYNFLLRMAVGDIVEAVLKGVIKEAGVPGFVSSEKVQVDVGGNTINGETDLSFDGMPDDIKSTSDYAFRNKFVSWDTLKADDPFGYVGQLHLYAKAKKAKPGGIWAFNVAKGHISRIECTDTDEERDVILKEIEDKVDTINLDLPFKRCFEDEEELFRKVPTGNRKLGMTCSWCKYRFSCWPGLTETGSIPSQAKTKPIVSYTYIKEEHA